MSLRGLSHSLVDNYKTCSERVRLERIERMPSVPGWSLPGGSLVHDVCANLSLQDFGVPTDGPLDFASAWDAYIAVEEEERGVPSSEWRASGRKSAAWPNKEDRGWWLEHGPQFVANWRSFLRNSAWQVWLTPEGIPAVELALAGEVGGVAVRGFLDVILERVTDGMLAVVDIKTGSMAPKTDDQLGLYRHLCKGIFPADSIPQWGFFYMARKNETSVPADLTIFDDGRLDHDYSTTWKGIEAGVFLPSPSNMCTACGVNKYCRSFGGELAGEVLPYSTQRVKVGAG